MLMKVETLRASIAEAKETLPQASVIYLSPQGQPLTQSVVQELAEQPEVIWFVAGMRGSMNELLSSTSIMKFLLETLFSQGEPAAIAVLDAVSRLVPGVLGHTSSALEDSFSDGLLDCPHYTRPEEIAGLKVPDVLLRWTSWRHRKVASKAGLGTDVVASV